MEEPLKDGRASIQLLGFGSDRQYAAATGLVLHVSFKFCTLMPKRYKVYTEV